LVAGLEVARVLPTDERDRHEADAHLICAAPDLLAALSSIWDCACREGDIDGETDWEAVRAAIAKARGGGQ
jgi:hypothetical protein